MRERDRARVHKKAVGGWGGGGWRGERQGWRKETKREIQREYIKRQGRGVGQKKPFRYAIRLEAKRA